MLKAVLFGSLSSVADLAEYEREAFNRAFLQHGLDISWTSSAYLYRMRHYGRFTGVDHDREKLGVHDLTSFYGDVELHFRDILDAQPIVADPWLKTSTKYLRQNGIKTVLVSGANRQTILRVLAGAYQVYASSTFDLIVCEEDTRAHKPAPDLYLAALEKLGVRPSEAIAVEITPQGIQAAKDAGLYTVAQPTSYIPQLWLKDANDIRSSTIQDNIDVFYETSRARAGSMRLIA